MGLGQLLPEVLHLPLQLLGLTVAAVLLASDDPRLVEQLIRQLSVLLLDLTQLRLAHPELLHGRIAVSLGPRELRGEPLNLRRPRLKIFLKGIKVSSELPGSCVTILCAICLLLVTGHEAVLLDLLRQLLEVTLHLVGLDILDALPQILLYLLQGFAQVILLNLQSLILFLQLFEVII